MDTNLGVVRGARVLACERSCLPFFEEAGQTLGWVTDTVSAVQPGRDVPQARANCEHSQGQQRARSVLALTEGGNIISVKEPYAPDDMLFHVGGKRSLRFASAQRAS
eukprot:1157869-Pelagomonas_calceolata.AAC.7